MGHSEQNRAVFCLFGVKHPVIIKITLRYARAREHARMKALYHFEDERRRDGDQTKTVRFGPPKIKRTLRLFIKIGNTTFSKTKIKKQNRNNGHEKYP